MAVPVQLDTTKRDEAYGGVTYHIEGELVPVLQIELQGVPVFFEHHILLWKDPHTEVGLKPLKGAFKRMIAGMPVLLTQARGPGRIAFSRDGAGHVFAIHLSRGDAVQVREHQFLAATDTCDYSFERVKGVTNMLLGGSGLFIDTFACHGEPGVVWLHGYGNVFDINLQPGEAIDIEPGGWIYKQTSVRMDTIFQRLATSIFGGAGQLVWNRFTGPGRVGLQSMYYHMPTSE